MIKVIIVDDDVDTVEVLCEFLEMYDIEIAAVGHDGKEGVMAYLKHKPDVIVTDIMMPEYDGFYLIKSIRSRDPDAKIIVATADVTIESRNKLKKLSPNAVLNKPYELDNLLKMIKSIGKGETMLMTY